MTLRDTQQHQAWGKFASTWEDLPTVSDVSGTLILCLYAAGALVGATVIGVALEREAGSAFAAAGRDVPSVSAAPAPLTSATLATAAGAAADGREPWLGGVPIERPSLPGEQPLRPAAFEVPPTTSSGLRLEATKRPEALAYATDATTPAIPAESATLPGSCAPHSSLRFAVNSANPIPSTSAGDFQAIAAWMEKHPQDQLILEGHTDASGVPEENLILSFRRAAAVKLELVRHGVPRERIEVMALGDRQPVHGAPPTSAENRRVVARLKGYEVCDDLANRW